MPAAVPILLIGGVIALLALLTGREVEAAPIKELPPKPPEPEPPPFIPCSEAEKSFILNVSAAADKGTATVEMLRRAIPLATRCRMGMFATSLSTKLGKILRKQAEIKETGVVPKPTSVKAKTDDFICGVLPGKGYACRPRNPEWKAKAKKFQNALNQAARKLPGPAETPKLIKPDGRIGLKTQTLLVKVVPRIPGTEFAAFRNVVDLANRPEDISSSLSYLTGQLTMFVKGKPAPTGVAGVGPYVSHPEYDVSDKEVGYYGMQHTAPLPGVSVDQWVDFVKCMKGRGGPKGVGMFKMNPNRLKKLGIHEAAFPRNKEGQYALFVKDMKFRTKDILQSKLRNAVGVDIEPGVAVSLSGILALCKQAGVKGAMSWLQNPKDRKSFPNTTEAFIACNGIF